MSRRAEQIVVVIGDRPGPNDATVARTRDSSFSIQGNCLGDERVLEDEPEFKIPPGLWVK
jgi:hypothetical protein